VDILALAAICIPTVAPATVQAIVKQESAAKPFAINVNGPMKLERQPKTLGEAIATAKELHSRGFNFDVGLGQINIKNLEKYNVTWEEAFDSCGNLRLLARVLWGCYDGALKVSATEQQALAKAFSCYNTGNYVTGFNNGYVGGIYSQARSVKP
jgi:type IV secretion system protein VirB1